jgi:hypothetical protein
MNHVVLVIAFGAAMTIHAFEHLDVFLVFACTFNHQWYLQVKV